MANLQKLEQKIGEALGLEKAAQVAVEELSAKGLLDEGGMKEKLQSMKKQANNHQANLEELMMKTYLEEDPDSSEAIEFLCLAEGGEVTHYEVLSALTKGVKNKKFGTKVKAILAEEKKHLQLCIRLAKQTAAGS